MGNSFFTNVFLRGNNIHYRGVKEDGSRSKTKHRYSPYLFIADPKGHYRSIDDKPIRRKNFDTIWECKNFIRKYGDVDNVQLYGLSLFEYTFIRDVFPKEIEFDSSLIRVGILDIEVKADEGFPVIADAIKPITAVTIKFKNNTYSFGCGEFHTDDPYSKYIKCLDERDLLQRFVLFWEKLDLDVVTGWSVRFFDIPYLVNRVVNVLGEDEALRFSPWKQINEKTVEFSSKQVLTYELAGISTLDYLELYRKFTFKNHESYALEAISQKELGQGKLAYRGSLEELYKNDHQKFIEYNIKDVNLVGWLDDKLGFLELVLAMAYDAKCNYNDCLSTIRPWDVIIHNYLLDRNIVIPFNQEHFGRKITGGAVRDPIRGLSKWVVGLDLTSLYPHLIMMINISPDTFMRKSTAYYDITKDGLKLNNKPEGDYTIAANGCLYRRDKQGFMAALMETKFKDRAALKKKMFSVIKRIEKFEGVAEELEQLKKDKSKYKNKQLAKKIQLNSLYGALLNEYFRWFSVENGEAITHTGQLVITFVVKMLNKLLNELFKTVDVDYVVASDTDSAYVCLDKYAETLHEVDEQIIADKIDDFCKKKIEPYLQKCFEDVAQTMNGYAQKLHMKREVIATKVVWTSKKHYIMNVIDDEGTRYEVPKLKVVGMESVRSSTPNACRKALEKGYELVLNGDQDPLMDFIDNFKEEFVSLPFVLKATPRGVNGMDRYEDEDTVYKIRTPQHVKAALLFNALLKKHDLINIPPIWNGDKIKFFPLRMPNPIGDEVIALPDNIPKELEYLTKFFDYDAQFNKMFFEPLKTVTKAVGWDIENKNSLEKFFI